MLFTGYDCHGDDENNNKDLTLRHGPVFNSYLAAHVERDEQNEYDVYKI